MGIGPCPLLAPVQQPANVSHRPGKAAHDTNRAQRPVFVASPGAERLSATVEMVRRAGGFYVAACFLFNWLEFCGYGGFDAMRKLLNLHDESPFALLRVEDDSLGTRALVGAQEWG